VNLTNLNANAANPNFILSVQIGILSLSPPGGETTTSIPLTVTVNIQAELTVKMFGARMQ